MDDGTIVTCEGLDELAAAADEVHVFVGQAPSSGLGSAVGTQWSGQPDRDPWALLPQLLRRPEYRVRVATQPGTRPTRAGTDLYLDATHDGDLLLVAVSRGCPVAAGLLDGLATTDEYAMATLTLAERRAVEHASGSDRASLLAQLWVRKDAVLRLCGGRAVSAQQLDATLPEGRGELVIPEALRRSWRRSVHVHDAVSGPDARAAVALAAEPREVHVWAVDYGNAIASQPSGAVAGAVPLVMNSSRSRHAPAAGR